MIHLQPYLNKGLIKNQKPDFDQISLQLRRAEKDLHTVRIVLDEDPSWASTMAYQSMLRAGRALLFAHGFLPADGQQHKTVVELTGKLLGPGSAVLSGHFERLRRKRNVFFYESDDSQDNADARRAVKAAHDLVAEIRKTIMGMHPQKTLEL